MNRQVAPRWPRDPDRPREPWAVRLFRLMVRLAPREFQLGDGEGISHLFSEVHAESVARHGVVGGVVALAMELPGLLRMIWLAWRDSRRLRARRSNHAVPRATMLDSISQDFRSALRFLRRSPGVAAVAILTLALGVGANTAMFSLVNGVLIKPLAFPKPDRLIALGEASPTSPPRTMSATSAASFLEWKASAHSASGMAAYSGRIVNITGFGEPEAVVSIPTAGSLLEVLGARPLFGRTLLSSDELPGAAPVAVLSYRTWQQFFGDDRQAVGRTMAINGTPVTIVGVMPPRFTFPFDNVALYEPMRWSPEERANRDQYGLSVVARLRDGVPMERVQAEMAESAARLRRDWSQYNTNLVINTVPLQESIVSGARQQLLLLMGAVAFILLITCANLANLMLARASARRREIVVRRALGAGGTRIIRQLLSESLLLAVLGGIAAIGVGRLLMGFFIKALQDSLPRVSDITLDPAVLLFTLGISVAAGIAFGLAPAIQLARGPASEALRDGTRTSGGRQGGRQALVVVQLALAVMLLAGAGLLLRSFAYLGRVNPGFDPRNVLTLRFSAPNGNPGFVDAMLALVKSIPGVQEAAVISQVPATGRGIGAWFNMYSRPVAPGETPPAEAYRVASPQFFTTARIPLVRGRLLGANDGRSGTPSIVVNEALAKKYWPNADPIGQEVYLGAPDNRLFDRATIVGIVRDTREAGLSAAPIPVVYAPRELMPWWRPFQLMVRTDSDPMAIVPVVRREIRALDPALTLRGIQTMESTLRDSLASNRWSLILVGAFASVALIMAGLGVFGVTSYLVSQRTKELGIRVALGAAPSRLRRMVVGQGVRLAVVGVVVGVAGAYALNGTIQGMLFGVRGTDPLTYASVAVLLVMVGALASCIPAWRSTRVDPVEALREG